MIWALIIGLIAGVIAKLIMPGKDPGGFIITMFLGVAGSVVANWIGTGLGYYDQDDGAGLIASIFGAVLILYIYRFIRYRRISKHSH